MMSRNGVRRRQTGRDGERGGIIVELAIVVPFLMVMILGTFEIGMGWSAKQEVVQASRGGARTITQLGTDPEADRSGLRAIRAAFGPEWNDIQRIVIYEIPYNSATQTAAAPDVPPLCLDKTTMASNPNGCVMYDTADLAQVNNVAWFSCTTGASANWCPTSRSDAQFTATFVGVYIEFERDYVTGFFGTGRQTIQETTVMRIEPAL